MAHADDAEFPETRYALARQKSLERHVSRVPRRRNVGSPSAVSGDDIGSWAQYLPAVANKSPKFDRLQRRKVIWTGVYPDRGQQHVNFKILDVRGVSHDILSRKIIASLLQHVNHYLRHDVTKSVGRGIYISVRVVLLEEI